MKPAARLAAVEKTKAAEVTKPAKAFKRRNGPDLAPSDPAQRHVVRAQIQATAEDSHAAGALGEASVSTDPAIQAAFSMRVIEGHKPDTGPGINELAYELEKRCEGVRAGDMSIVEDMLLTQAHTLDCLFGKMTRKAAINMAEYPEAFERYMRLGLKAQSQCRATLEALILAKNPPNVAFVKQANYAAGHQQVNNGPHAHGAEKQLPTNKLLGVTSGERLDFAAPKAASGANQELEAVGALHRPQDSERQDSR